MAGRGLISQAMNDGQDNGQGGRDFPWLYLFFGHIFGQIFGHIPGCIPGCIPGYVFSCILGHTLGRISAQPLTAENIPKSLPNYKYFFRLSQTFPEPVANRLRPARAGTEAAGLAGAGRIGGFRR